MRSRDFSNNLERLMNVPANLPRLSEAVEEYNLKVSEIETVIENCKRATIDDEMQSTVGGTFANSIWSIGGMPRLSSHVIKSNLKKSAWLYVYRGLNLDKIASA